MIPSLILPSQNPLQEFFPFGFRQRAEVSLDFFQL